MTVYVDPACNINYGSFYIKGLWNLYGRKNVEFTSRYFKKLKYTTDSHCIAFVVAGKKYVIDFADSNRLFYDCFLEWADEYGKVNYFQEAIPQKWAHKVHRVGANFGIGCFGRNKYTATLKCLINFSKCFRRLKYGFKGFLSPYLWLYKRSRISWEPSVSTVGSRKIFMVSRYWKGQPWVNNARIDFIRACRRLQKEGEIEFIGGLIPDTKEHDCPDDVLLDSEIPLADYMKHLDESLLVFNTPAYHRCHGWKLPEYLAHGKIILSTPFVNELPIPLEDRENIFFTESNEGDIYKAIKEIVNNQALQKTLEEGSRKYWEEYGSPAACLKYFIYGKTTPLY